jgi:transposase
VLIHVPLDVRVLAMDVHKNTISTGLLEPGSTSPVLDKVSADDESVRRLIARFEDPCRVWACYEAGPTGYELARVLRSVGMCCEVIPVCQGEVRHLR